MSNSELIRRCIEVRDELEPSGNTAQRVGQLLADIVEELGGGNTEELTIKMDGNTVGVYDGSEPKTIDITPESIGARRIAEAGSFITNGLSNHFFATDAISGYGVDKYIPLIRMHSDNIGKMDVIFSIGSREWGHEDNYYGKWRFSSRSGYHTLDCIEFYNASTVASHVMAFDDIVYAETGRGNYPDIVIYRKVRSAVQEYFYVSIEGENNSGYTTYTYYTSNQNLKNREQRASAVNSPGDVHAAADRRPSLIQSVDDEEFIAISQRIKNTYNIKRISECALDGNGLYVALPTDEMLIVDSTTGINNASLLGIKLTQGVTSPYGQDGVIQLTVCNISGATTTVYYEYESEGSVQQAQKTNTTGQKDTFVCIAGNWVREY